jgi:putative transposase
VIPGTIYLLTRRCSERRFFLLPEAEVTQIFSYLLGLLAKKYGIEVHAFVAMSNHYHLVATDTKGQMPRFQRELNSMLARAVNFHWDRSESFWDRRSYSAVELVEDGDVLEKVVYTLANPVAARLVERAGEWTGATSVGMAFGEVRRIPRPEKFFRAGMPEFAELELKRPGCFAGVGDDALLETVAENVARLEREHRQRGPAMGMAAVLRQDHESKPGSREARRELEPTVACKNPVARAEALRVAREWLDAYKAALALFVDGVRDVVFPRGTWWMCAQLRCAMATG